MAKHQFLLILFSLGVLPPKFMFRLPNCYPSQMVYNVRFLQWLYFAAYIQQLETYNVSQFLIYQQNLQTWCMKLNHQDQQDVFKYINTICQFAHHEASKHYQKRLTWLLYEKPRQQDPITRHDTGLHRLKTFPFYDSTLPPPPRDPSREQVSTGPCINNDSLPILQMPTTNNSQQNVQDFKSSWIVNLSSQQFSIEEMELLSLGYKFAIPDYQLSSFNWFQHIEKIINEISNPVEQNVVRTKLTNKLKRFHKLYGSNKQLIDTKRKLMKLKHNREVKFLAADKGNKTVIMNSNEYNEKVLAYLENPLLFKKLDKDPTDLISSNLKQLLGELKNEKEINKSFYYNSTPPQKTFSPTIFGQVKLHKDSNPLRFIINGRNNPCVNLSKCLVKALNPLRKHIIRTVKNARDVVDIVKNIHITSTSKLYSIDVQNMFNSLPIQFVIDAVRHYMEKNADKLELNKDTMVKLIEFCIRNSYCTAFKNSYQQIDGLAMGSPLSPILSDITMSYFEDLHLHDHNLKLWIRYVDDTFIIWNGTKRQFDNWFKKINNINPKIQFTYEEEQNDEINFLDLTIFKKQNSLGIRLFRKQTFSGRYIPFNSAHSISTKKGIAIGLFKKALHLCTDEHDKNKEIQFITQILQMNGYPKKIINSCLYIARNNTTNDGNEPQQKQWRKLPYVPKLTESLTQDLKGVNVNIAYTTVTTIGSLLYKKHCKLSKNILEHEGVIYNIPCKCGESYIGETKRKLGTRVKEHQYYTQQRHQDDPYLRYKSAIAQHAKQTGHEIAWDKVQILGYESDDTIRKLKESFYIKKYNPSINVSPGVAFPPQWHYIFNNELS